MSLDEISKISRLILQNPNRMVREQDLQNLCPNPETFSDIIKKIMLNFKDLGMSLVRTKFNNERFFVLTAPGKDERISPTMYGVMALIIATNNEIGQLSLEEMKKIYASVWSEIENLIRENYLAIVEEKNIKNLEITPIGKAAFKSIFQDLDLHTLISKPE